MEERARLKMAEWTRRKDNHLKCISELISQAHTDQASSSSHETQIPPKDQHTRIIIIPLNVDSHRLLIALGAEVTGDVSSPEHNGRKLHSYLVPESLGLSGGRYSRTGEFFDSQSGEEVHGFKPATIYAPDKTLLMNFNDLGGKLNFTLGTTWIQTNAALASFGARIDIPEDVVFSNGDQGYFHLGQEWELVLNGIETQGLMPHGLRTTSELRRIYKTEMKEVEKELLDSFGGNTTEFYQTYEMITSELVDKFITEHQQPLIDHDSIRGSKMALYLGELGEIQAALKLNEQDPHVSTTQSSMLETISPSNNTNGHGLASDLLNGSVDKINPTYCDKLGQREML